MSSEDDRRESSERASGDFGAASSEDDRRESSERASGDFGAASSESLDGSSSEDHRMTADSSSRRDRWVYESIVGAIPGVHVPRTWAVGIQLGLFELGVLVLAALTDRWEAVPAGTAAVVVVSAGSVLMLTLGRRIRGLDVPDIYIHTLFGSQIEIVLGVLSFVGLTTYLFVADPRQAGQSLLNKLLGPEPSLLAVYFTLLVLWDVCYRIGTGWWASLVGLWRSVIYADRFDAETREALVAVDLITIGFAVVQVIMLPFLAGHPLLVVLVSGHVAAVTVVSGTSILLLWRRQ